MYSYAYESGAHMDPPGDIAVVVTLLADKMKIRRSASCFRNALQESPSSQGGSDNLAMGLVAQFAKVFMGGMMKPNSSQADSSAALVFNNLQPRSPAARDPLADIMRPSLMLGHGTQLALCEAQPTGATWGCGE